MGQTKRYINIFIILCGALFIAFVVVTSEIAERRFKNSAYSGIVKEKVFKPNRRGFSDVLVDSVWHEFGIQEDGVSVTVAVGDSIVKKVGRQGFCYTVKIVVGFGLWLLRIIPTRKIDKFVER